MARDPAILAHQEWLGYVQPSGLVVSIPAMLEANLRINANQGPEHRQFLEYFLEDKDGEPIAMLGSFPEFAEAVLGWQTSDLYGAPGSDLLPESLEVALPEYNETLRPTYALREFDPAPGANEWILLVQVLPDNPDFDAVPEMRRAPLAGQPAGQVRTAAAPDPSAHRPARQPRSSPSGLRPGQGTQRLHHFQAAGNGHSRGPAHLRRLPTTAWVRAALQRRQDERLPAMLANSRKYQNVVSTQLANQVLEALYELLRGFQAANDQTQGELLRRHSRPRPRHRLPGPAHNAAAHGLHPLCRGSRAALHRSRLH